MESLQKVFGLSQNFQRVSMGHKCLIKYLVPEKHFSIPSLQSIDPGDSYTGAELRTTLGFGPLQIQTTEHLLSALSGFSIDNAVIELDNAELPGLDGSAKGFSELIRRSGIIEQAAEKKYLKIDKVIWVCGKGG